MSDLGPGEVMPENNAPARIWILLHEGEHGAHVWCDQPDSTGAGECEVVEYVRVVRIQKPGRDDKQDAIEAGVEAAAVAVRQMGWGELAHRRHMIAVTAARIAVEDLWERMHA